MSAKNNKAASTNGTKSNGVEKRDLLTSARLSLRRVRKRRSSSAPPATGRRSRLLEEHFRVDPERKVILPGVPKHEADSARDMHDFFNLIMLVPVVVLNVMNWNWDMLLNMPKNKTFGDAWTGEWFEPFFRITVIYFVADAMWITLVPSCVRSPATIIQHHIAALLYIMVPYSIQEAQWCMGACMIVEINTWFLIARRVFNKQGFSPWIIDLPPFLSIRVKLISIFFYLTWISIRCVLYPLLSIEFYRVWLERSAKVGTKWNLIIVVLPLHTCFCLLNLKWSYDLLMSKVRYWRRKGRNRNQQQPTDKGL